MKYFLISCLFIISFSITGYAQLKFNKTVGTVPRSQNSSNSNNLKMDKIEYNETTYYMLRFHNFFSKSRYEHPEMVPYCDHPNAFIERYYFYIFDASQMDSLKKHYESGTKFSLKFVAEGYFDKEYPLDKSAGLFNWPNIKTNKALKESFGSLKSTSVFTFYFDRIIRDFTPIRFDNFTGETWLKNKKIEKFISLI